MLDSAVDAALIVCVALEMPSSRPESELARLVSEAAVKKLTGLSRAELTFLPVDRRCWACCARTEVFWSEVRAARTPAERVTAMTFYLLVTGSLLASTLLA